MYKSKYKYFVHDFSLQCRTKKPKTYFGSTSHGWHKVHVILIFCLLSHVLWEDVGQRICNVVQMFASWYFIAFKMHIKLTCLVCSSYFYLKKWLECTLFYWRVWFECMLAKACKSYWNLIYKGISRAFFQF